MLQIKVTDRSEWVTLYSDQNDQSLLRVNVSRAAFTDINLG